MASFFLVATLSPPSVPNQKRGPFHRDFNFAARFSIILSQPRFAIKMRRAKRRCDFELAKFARRQGGAFLSFGQVRIDMLNENLPLMLAYRDEVQSAIVCFCFWSEMERRASR